MLPYLRVPDETRENSTFHLAEEKVKFFSLYSG